MNRFNKEKLNAIVALLNQIITIICGFILPRYFLKNYGSEVYGLINSIAQFLGFVTLMELGMGAVVQASLYKPLAEKDKKQISCIIASTDRFFKKVALVFMGYTFVLSFAYPFLNSGKFSWLFDASLIIIIAISSFAEYFFGITYRLLLMADQKAYITHGLSTISIILNFIVCIVLMKLGCSIHIVKLVSALVMLLRPFGQSLYVNIKYKIDKKIKYTGEPIQQKWNGIAQHVAYYITNNTDTILLTLFSSLQNVAIYSVYNMVANGFKQLILTFNSGTMALYGEMIARNETVELNNHFRKYEIFVHAVVIVIYSCIVKLIIPFVAIYTQGISDVDYIQPTFAVLITVANGIYCLRLPYNTLVGASGHYKQTQTSALIETVLNLSISIILVRSFGLIGVAIGTVVSLTYRTIYLGYYARQIIPQYSMKLFIRNIIVDAVEVLLILSITSFITVQVNNYFQWVLYGISIFIVSIVVVVVSNIIINRKRIMPMIVKITSKYKNDIKQP